LECPVAEFALKAQWELVTERQLPVSPALHSARKLKQPDFALEGSVTESLAFHWALVSRDLAMVGLVVELTAHRMAKSRHWELAMEHLETGS
jgi:hypothetical protein